MVPARQLWFARLLATSPGLFSDGSISKQIFLPWRRWHPGKATPAHIFMRLLASANYFMVRGNQSTISGKTMMRIVVANSATMRMLVPL